MNVFAIDNNGYVIDQTGSVTTDSDKMITVGKGVSARIKQIHDNSHLYVGELINGTLVCKQLLDTDKTKYADGTSLVLGENENVFLKLPRFWWKATSNEDNADICEINFTMDNPQDLTWHEWEGDTFIGAYKGVVINNKLRSKAGELISGTTGEYTRTSRNNYRTYARNNGSGFCCLLYEAIHMLALLGFGWLKTLSSISIFGNGSSTKFTSGICDALGMEDGSISSHTNFWGLEGYISGTCLHEYVDNITRNSTNLITIMKSSDMTTVRTVQANPTLNGNRWITKIVLGDYADIFATETVTARLGNNTKYVCYTNISNTSFLFVNGVSNSNSGFIGLQAVNADTTVVNMATSRLCYKGNYQIIN